ncbi:hypothetical protein Ddc_17898 [Ditylenchus destructor]|nr:hypothetical protein Ddc_17898 [Ditylenchus destructor]
MLFEFPVYVACYLCVVCSVAFQHSPSTKCITRDTKRPSIKFPSIHDLPSMPAHPAECTITIGNPLNPAAPFPFQNSTASSVPIVISGSLA